MTVAVSPERAWEVFTAQMADWWPLHTHSIAAFEGSVPERLVLEPGVGGEIYEETGGVRRHWARIDGWEPPHRLSYTWHVNPENPPTNVTVTFEPVDGGDARYDRPLRLGGLRRRGRHARELRLGRRLGARRGELRFGSGLRAATGIPWHRRTSHWRVAEVRRMAENGWLTKGEVNSLYYNTVAGEISFITEAAVGAHPFAIARLIEHQAADVGRQADPRCSRSAPTSAASPAR